MERNWKTRLLALMLIALLALPAALSEAPESIELPDEVEDIISETIEPWADELIFDLILEDIAPFDTPTPNPFPILKVPAGIAIDAANFPNDDFRYIVKQFDTNYDGALSDAEIAKITSIFCQSKSITSLQGIEYFTSLRTLLCLNCGLTSLDVSRNTQLVWLNCANNALTSLNVTANTALEGLICWGNRLSTLNLSRNSKLNCLWCYNNRLTTLDVSHCPMLSAIAKDEYLMDAEAIANLGLNYSAAYGYCRILNADADDTYDLFFDRGVKLVTGAAATLAPTATPRPTPTPTPTIAPTPTPVPTLPPRVIDGALNLPRNLTTISAEAFKGVPVTYLYLPKSVKRIEANAFANTDLREIYFTANVSYIAPSAFSGCKNLIADAPEGSYAEKWCKDNGVAMFKRPTVAHHTQAEIQNYVKNHPVCSEEYTRYDKAPTTSPYDPGTLSMVTQQAAINMVNRMRYIAGLNADVEYDANLARQAMAASLVNKLNSALSHRPERPEALADSQYDALYQLGYDGASSSNLAYGYDGLPSTVEAYMRDGSSFPSMGHRRWILNPPLKKTAFGASGMMTVFSAMSVFDESGSGDQIGVAWPAQEMPVTMNGGHMFDSVWTFSLGERLADDAISMTMRRESDGKLWYWYTGDDGEIYGDGFLTVSNAGYGQPGTIVFIPADIEDYVDGDEYTITFRNARSRNYFMGEAQYEDLGSYCYHVHFFNLDQSGDKPLDTVIVTAANVSSGIQLKWNTVSGATGYAVCRRDASTGDNYDYMSNAYFTLADVKGSSYVDATAVSGKTYQYQIIAYTSAVSSKPASNNKNPIITRKKP